MDLASLLAARPVTQTEQASVDQNSEDHSASNVPNANVSALQSKETEPSLEASGLIYDVLDIKKSKSFQRKSTISHGTISESTSHSSAETEKFTRHIT